MKTKKARKEVCPVAKSLEAIGDAWSVLIVRDAFFGKRRFGEFLTSLGVARNILTDRLRKLVALGVLDRVPAADGSAHREYVLTEKGRGLFVVVMAIRQWGAACSAAGSNLVLVDRRDGKPVRPLTLQAHDGRELAPGDVELIPAPHEDDAETRRDRQDDAETRRRGDAETEKDRRPGAATHGAGENRPTGIDST